MAEEKFNQEPYISWQIHAYQHHDRGALWYVLAGIIGGGLLVVSFMTNNFLLAVLVLMAGIVLLIQGSGHPDDVVVELGPTGIYRGEDFYPYRSIQKFWIIYDPPVKSLYLNVSKSMFSPIHFPIDGQDPNELRAVLKKFVSEDLSKDAEPLFDSISRILKI